MATREMQGRAAPVAPMPLQGACCRDVATDTVREASERRARTLGPDREYAMSEIEDCIGALTNRGIRKAPAIVFLLLGTMFVAQGKAAAAVLKCASHSLNREDAFKVKAIARSSLPRSTQSSLSWACWNPENAYARIETRQSGTPDGVKRWWEILCRREGQAEWHCDPAE